MYCTGLLASFDKKTTTTNDWFEAKCDVMIPVTEAKRATLEYKRLPSEKILQVLRAARNKVKQAARKCANEYWIELSNDIHSAAITGNIRKMYDGIKKKS